MGSWWDPAVGCLSTWWACWRGRAQRAAGIDCIAGCLLEQTVEAGGPPGKWTLRRVQLQMEAMA